MFKVLVTAQPIVMQAHRFMESFLKKDMDPTFLKSDQTVSKDLLLRHLPSFDGWILGDEVCDQEVLTSGKDGRLKAILRWGAGLDNVDLRAASDLQIPVTNTPGTFANEVADMALGYLISLSREISQVSEGIFEGEWLKPIGVSLEGKNVGVVGLGAIGVAISHRVQVLGMEVFGYDPAFEKSPLEFVKFKTWPLGLEELDFLILACPLTSENRKMINRRTLSSIKQGCSIINVARGGLIDQEALIEALQVQKIKSVALDVYETEPLGLSPLLKFKQNLYGSHNASNTFEAVDRTTQIAIEKLSDFLRRNSE